MYALVFVIKAVIRTLARSSAQKVLKLVLVKAHRTGIFLIFLVIVIKLAGVTSLRLFVRFIHNFTPYI